MPIIASRASAAYGAGFGKLLSSAGAAADYSGFDALYSTTLTGNTSVVTITGIPQNYNHLQVRIVSRSTNADYRSGLSMRMNNDDANSSGYFFHRLWLGSGTNAGASNSDTANYAGMGMTADSLSLAGSFAISITDILDYSSPSKGKNFRTIAHYNNGSTGANDGDKGGIVLTSGMKDSYEQVHTLQIFQGGGSSLVADTTISLYGIR